MNHLEIQTDGQIILNGEQSNFKAQEMLPRAVWEHPTRRAEWYLREGTVALIQFCRDWWGVPIYLNNWHRGGERNLAGFRLPHTGIIDHLLEEGMSESKAMQIKQGLLSVEGWDEEMLTLGSWWSQHKFSLALDPKIKGLSADDARQEILDNQDEFMAAGLTTLESGRFAPTWVHMDRRITALDHILMVGA